MQIMQKLSKIIICKQKYIQKKILIFLQAVD